MFYCTKQESLVLIFLALVFLFGTTLQFFFKKHPYWQERIDLIENNQLYAQLDLNKADEKELESLPCIGRTIARRIIAYRTQHGCFRSLEELTSIRGISPIVLNRLSRFLSIIDSCYRGES